MLYDKIARGISLLSIYLFCLPPVISREYAAVHNQYYFSIPISYYSLTIVLVNTMNNLHVSSLQYIHLPVVLFTATTNCSYLWMS